MAKHKIVGDADPGSISTAFVDASKRILEFLSDKLTPEDIQTVGGIIQGAVAGMQDMATDDPAPFPGQPLTGGGQVPMTRLAQDQRRRSILMNSSLRADFDSRYPNAARIKGA